MNRWQRSVGEIQARRKQVSKCEHAQSALGRVTACYQQMATSLGSNTDGSSLREELERTRALAHRICTGLHQSLLALLVETEQGQEDREQVERLWVLFLSCLESFQQDLRRVSTLEEIFPLTQRKDRQALVNTGAVGGGSEVASRAATVQVPWATGDEEPRPDLRAHVVEIDGLLQEMLRSVNIPLWSVEPTQKAWAEACKDGQDELEDVLEEMMEVEVVSQDNRASGCCSHSTCRLGCAFCLLN
ncbi:regulator of G-protein signaling 9-binding protein [Brachyhypopomus gauderio]|uniref:regulator of G-protein signaling 9-binding protein n=1 Tax=Brachyhypopomus gauderio TaxID=698409 RepID=UPI004042492D